jgi:uncharacterized membrane protein
VSDPFLSTWGSLVAICGMALVTYLWRGGGYFLMGFIRPHPRLTRALVALPGAVIVATVLPIILRTGPLAAVALAVGLGVMAWRRNDLVAVAAGLATAILLRVAGLPG